MGIMTISLEAKHFPLTDNVDALINTYTSPFECAIAKWLRENSKSSYMQVVDRGWIFRTDSKSNLEPDVVFNMHVFIDLNNEFMNGRKEPFIINYKL